MKKMLVGFGILFLIVLSVFTQDSIVRAVEPVDFSFGQPDFKVGPGGESDLIAFVQLQGTVGYEVEIHFYSYGSYGEEFASSTFTTGEMVEFQLNPLAVVFKFVADPNGIVEEVDECNNQARWPSAEPTCVTTETPTVVFTPTEIVATSTSTPVPTEIPVVILAVWNVVADEVTISWNTVAQYHLYQDGGFVENSVADHVTVKKSAFALSVEVAIDPEGQNLKVYLTWEQLFGAPTTTPEPTETLEPPNTPEPTQTVVPTTTPTPLDPNPKVTVTANQVEVEDISPPWSIHLYWWQSESTQPIFEWTDEAKSFEVQINDGLVEILMLNGDEVVSKVEYPVRGKQILYQRGFLPVIEVR